MRVAIVGTELCALDRRGGGLERVVLRWADALTAAGHEVVLVSHAPGGRAPELSASGPETVTVARPAMLRPVLRSIAPDVVSLHNRPQWARLCPRAATVTVTFHNFPAGWKVRARAWPTTRAASGRLMASAVSAALAAAAAEALALPPGGVRVTQPSIDPAFLVPPARAPSPTVIFPNRLLRKKGVRDLLAAARRPTLRDVRFAFTDLLSPWLAPTAEHTALRRAIAAVPNATLWAPAAPAELAARYATAGVVACPSREPEGLGLVALEAQACGAPLVSTDVGGLREATFAPNACVVPGDIDALADALVTALQPGTAREEARRSVVERYSPRASGAAFLRWVAEAVR